MKNLGVDFNFFLLTLSFFSQYIFYSFGLVSCIILMKEFVLDKLLFKNLRRFFLRKVWLLNIVPYASESRKLPVPSLTFGPGACNIIMTSSEPQKLVLMPWTQSKGMKTLAIDMFSWDSSKTIFWIKIDNVLTLHNNKWGIVASSDLENTFL